MSLLFETIKIEYGQPKHLYWHQHRLNHTFAQLWGKSSFDITSVYYIPMHLRAEKMVKGKMVYSEGGFIHWEFEIYKPKLYSSFEIINIEFDYDFKYYDRRKFNELINQISPSTIPTFFKNGLLSDGHIFNIAILKNGNWSTPFRPILQGTTLSRLVAQSILTPKNIEYSTLHTYEKIKFFNAMTGWGNAHIFDI